MSVLHVVHGSVSQNSSNGVNSVVRSLYSEFLQTGFLIQILSIRSNNFNTPSYELCDETFVKSQFASILSYFLKKRSTIDTIHFHGVLIPFNWLLILWAKTLGFRIVISPHGGAKYSRSIKGAVRYLSLVIIERFLGKLVDAVHVLNLDERRVLSSVIPQRKIHVIPNGVNRPEKLKQKNGDFTCLFLGRIHFEQKGIDLMLDSWKEYKKNGGKGSLKIAGEGIDKIRLEAWLSYNDTFDIEYLGPVYGEKKVELFNNSKAFLLFSRWEGMPIAVLEAISYNLKCIVSTHTNLDEFRQNGLVFTSSNNSRKNAAIIKALEEDWFKDRSKWLEDTKYCSDFLDLNYSWSVITNAYKKRLYNA